MNQRIVVIGGGAAGFFGAISAASHFPQAEVLLLEKHRMVLNKVRISGGGRCNVTHDCLDNRKLAQKYPRGGSFLRPLFNQFNVKNTIDWFENQGVILKTEPDGRVFPTTDSSETIIEALMNAAQQVGVKIQTSCGVKSLAYVSQQWNIACTNDQTLVADAVLITTGGNPQLSGYQWLEVMGLSIVPPIPSLFTFNVPLSPLQALSGVSVPNVIVKVAGKKLMQDGPLLITHWGFSGPAILKLSAWAARELAELNYQFVAIINWLPMLSEDNLREEFQKIKQTNPKKQIATNPMFGLPARLWETLAGLSEIEETRRWIDISNKQANKLINHLLNYQVQVNGKTTFKEEFVTAGGIALSEINPQTMESLKHKGLFFAGEVLDIDAVTGGFNFQAAWTTGFVAGKHCLR